MGRFRKEMRTPVSNFRNVSLSKTAQILGGAQNNNASPMFGEALSSS